MTKREIAKQTLERLRERYGSDKTALKFYKDYELLIAVILSAQCTDERVNQVTKNLFKVLPTLESFNEVSLEDLEKLIFSTGFYKSKARNIKKCVKKLLSSYNGILPQDMKNLVTLSGVGRKTANVVLNELFRTAEGIVVDTHIYRVSKRLGLAKGNSAVIVERELMKILPKKDWIDYGSVVILHGRERCKARKPQCSECILKDVCKYYSVK